MENEEKVKVSWLAKKKELWKMPVAKLMEVLKEFEKEKMKLEYKLRQDGYLNDRIATPKEFRGNLKQVRKQIACVKTMLNVKLMNKPI